MEKFQELAGPPVELMARTHTFMHPQMHRIYIIKQNTGVNSSISP